MVDSPPIFLSYARADSEFCLKLAQDLQQAGVRMWMDQLDIRPGMRWDDEIQIAIKQADTMLVVLSPDSIESKNVRDEVNFALDRDDTIVPVLLRSCEIPFRLLRIQHIDFTSDYDAAFERLIARLTGLPQQAESRLPDRKSIIHGQIAWILAGLAVLTASWIGWHYLAVPVVPGELQLGMDYTIVDTDGDFEESISLDPGATLSNGEPIASYQWTKNDRLAARTRVLSINLEPGMHTIDLAATNEDSEQFEDTLQIKVITAADASTLQALMDLAQSNINLAAEEFNPAYLTDGVSSAYAALKSALEIDPFNESARGSIKRIADLIETQARKAIEEHNIVQADILVNKGLGVDPQHEGLNSIRDQLDQ